VEICGDKMDELKNWAREQMKIVNALCGELNISNEGVVLQVMLDKAIKPFHFWKQENDGGKKEIKSDLPDVSDIELYGFVKRKIENKGFERDHWSAMFKLAKQYNPDVKYTKDVVATLSDIPKDVLRRNLVNWRMIR